MGAGVMVVDDELDATGDREPRVVVEARDLVKEYRVGQQVRRAIDGVSLAVPAGRFVSVMGPSGSGKSTLLHLLGGLDVPTSGEVLLDGVALAGRSERELSRLRRTQVGFVFQAFNLVPVLTVEENIALPLVFDGRTDSAAAARVDEMIALVGLEQQRLQRPSSLSGGEQQRTAIARALVTDPQVLLADEPTGSLDSTTGAGVVEVLRDACRDTNRSVVVVTHDPRVAAMGDQVVDLWDGQVSGMLDLSPRRRVRRPDQVISWLGRQR